MNIDRNLLPQKTNMTSWKNKPFEDVSPIQKGDFPVTS